MPTDTLVSFMGDDSVQRLLVRLRALRVERGLTQEEFAERFNFGYKYYQAVEAGRKRDLRLSTLDRLASAHGLETWQLLLPEGETVTPAKRTKSVAKKSVKRAK